MVLRKQLGENRPADTEGFTLLPLRNREGDHVLDAGTDAAPASAEETTSGTGRLVGDAVRVLRARVQTQHDAGRQGSCAAVSAARPNTGSSMTRQPPMDVVACSVHALDEGGSRPDCCGRRRPPRHQPMAVDDLRIKGAVVA